MAAPHTKKYPLEMVNGMAKIDPDRLFALMDELGWKDRPIVEVSDEYQRLSRLEDIIGEKKYPMKVADGMVHIEPDRLFAFMKERGLQGKPVGEAVHAYQRCAAEEDGLELVDPSNKSTPTMLGINVANLNDQQRAALMSKLRDTLPADAQVFIQEMPTFDDEQEEATDEEETRGDELLIEEVSSTTEPNHEIEMKQRPQDEAIGSMSLQALRQTVSTIMSSAGEDKTGNFVIYPELTKHEQAEQSRVMKTFGVTEAELNLLFPLRYPPALYQSHHTWSSILTVLRKLQGDIIGGGWTGDREKFLILAEADADPTWKQDLLSRLKSLCPGLTDAFLLRFRGTEYRRQGLFVSLTFIA